MANGEVVAIATDSDTEPYMIVKVLSMPSPAQVTRQSTFSAQKYEPLQPGGSILKLTEKELEGVECSSVRVANIELAECKSRISGVAAPLPRSTRLATNQKQGMNGTFMLQPSTKQSILQRAALD